MSGAVPAKAFYSSFQIIFSAKAKSDKTMNVRRMTSSAFRGTVQQDHP
jgi:hypothetical protein